MQDNYRNSIPHLDTAARYAEPVVAAMIVRQIASQEKHNQKENDNKIQFNAAVFAVSMQEAYIQEFYQLMVNLQVMDKIEQTQQDKEQMQKEAAQARDQYDESFKAYAAATSPQALTDFNESILRDKMAMIQELIADIDAKYSAAKTVVMQDLNVFTDQNWKPALREQLAAFMPTLQIDQALGLDPERVAAVLNSDVREVIENRAPPQKMLETNPIRQAIFDGTYAKQIEAGLPQVDAAKAALKAAVQPMMDLATQIALAAAARKLHMEAKAGNKPLGSNSLRYAVQFANENYQNTDAKPHALAVMATDLMAAPMVAMAELNRAHNYAVGALQHEVQNCQQAIDRNRVSLDIKPVTPKPNVVTQSAAEKNESVEMKAIKIVLHEEAVTKLNLINQLCKDQFIDAGLGMSVANLAKDFVDGTIDAKVMQGYFDKFASLKDQQSALLQKEPSAEKTMQLAAIDKQINKYSNALREEIGFLPDAQKLPIDVTQKPNMTLTQSISDMAQMREKINVLKNFMGPDLYAQSMPAVIKLSAICLSDAKIHAQLDSVIEKIKPAQANATSVKQEVGPELEGFRASISAHVIINRSPAIDQALNAIYKPEPPQHQGPSAGNR